MNIMWLPLTLLDPHPQNPRFAPRRDVVDQLAAQIQDTEKFEPMYALIVRPMEGRYQIVSGHHRRLAAAQAGLAEVPCWVREMSDDEAYMALVLNNVQSELSPLEEGMHALGSGMKLGEYATHVGKEVPTVQHRWQAAKVAASIIHVDKSALADSWRALDAIHPAPEWLWPALVAKLLTENWTVETTRTEVRRVGQCEAPPDWADLAAIATGVVDMTFKATDVPRFAKIEATAIAYQPCIVHKSL